ncbi:uncharacterized protein AMSG_06884 [Thecamonas trahens ATCC 50062]|uniref:GPI-anchor transamidase n=1 Tax=Thecamonas trahens ATCC 50062 TaxID=461836 RepID=A0A0L0DGC3_THETB|nr:hypothetical protein AMSG_06884 [Thecamonas trahens ATCC 50062]KNC50393.1 hypothetical protein AMSG_06884 [Thecamonas trahens ATCC 50062]|eukprot:XP_013756935.1 hypothetical protein AMSG_06884 [Thecamonas trahens ATCC 50062]
MVLAVVQYLDHCPATTATEALVAGECVLLAAAQLAVPLHRWLAAGGSRGRGEGANGGQSRTGQHGQSGSRRRRGPRSSVLIIGWHAASLLAAAVAAAAGAGLHGRSPSSAAALTTADAPGVDGSYAFWWRVALLAWLAHMVGLAVPAVWMLYAYDVRWRLAAVVGSASLALAAVAGASLLGAVPTLGMLAPMGVCCYGFVACMWSLVARRTRSWLIWAGVVSCAVLGLIAFMEPLVDFRAGPPPPQQARFTNHSLARLVSLLVLPGIALAGIDLAELVVFPWRGWGLGLGAVAVAVAVAVLAAEVAVAAEVDGAESLPVAGTSAGAGDGMSKVQVVATDGAEEAVDVAAAWLARREAGKAAAGEGAAGEGATGKAAAGGGAGDGGHTSNWAVLVCASRYWFNYRHIANTLSLYRSVQRLGIPDSHIILMLADDMACNSRNIEPAHVFNSGSLDLNLYGEAVEVDYRGYEVTAEAFLRVLTGRTPPGTAKSKMLRSDAGSNILVFMTGHGGDQFLKFQDSGEVTSVDLADAFASMASTGRFNEMLVMADTCQADTLFSAVTTPGIVTVGSSVIGESSYSYSAAHSLGVAVIDRFTYHTLSFLENRVRNASSPATLADLRNHITPSKLGSTPSWRTSHYPRSLADVPIADFFAAVPELDFIDAPYPLDHLEP